ncbi:MAG: lipid II flippase MurJ [Rectinemataceae bacterium]|nr:lipid II flippase MurJ [Rectinemataceae bacterium]
MTRASKRRLFGRRESTVSSSVEMAVFSILNTALNFLRSVIIAANYGAGAMTDAYYSMVGLLNTPAGLLSDSLTALVPTRSQAYREKGQQPDYIASYLSVTTAAFIALAAIFAIFGRTIVKIVLTGFNSEAIGSVYYLILLSLPAIVLAPLCCIIDNALKSDRYFIFGNTGGLINSIISTGLLFFISRSGVKGVVYSTLAGLTVNFIILIWAAVRKKILPGHIDLRLGIREAKKAFPLFLGGILGIAAGYVEKYLASFLPSGSITLLSMSTSLLGAARGLLVGTFISVYYPFVSEAVIAGDKKKYNDLMDEAKRIIFGLFGLGVVCMVVFAQPLFMLLFGHGRFGSEDVASLAAIFAVGTFGIVQTGLSNLAGFSFYAKGDTKTPVACGFFAGTLVRVLLQFLVIRALGAMGLSAATAVAGMGVLLLETALLSRKHKFSILKPKEIILAFLILSFSLALGFMRWTPWSMILPFFYYIFISVGKYGLSPRRILMMAKGAFK